MQRLLGILLAGAFYRQTLAADGPQNWLIMDGAPLYQTNPCDSADPKTKCDSFYILHNSTGSRGFDPANPYITACSRSTHAENPFLWKDCYGGAPFRELVLLHAQRTLYQGDTRVQPILQEQCEKFYAYEDDTAATVWGLSLSACSHWQLEMKECEVTAAAKYNLLIVLLILIPICVAVAVALFVWRCCPIRCCQPGWKFRCCRRRNSTMLEMNELNGVV